MTFQSLNEIFFERAKENADKPFLFSKINKEWKSLSMGRNIRKSQRVFKWFKGPWH